MDSITQVPEMHNLYHSYIDPVMGQKEVQTKKVIYIDMDDTLVQYSSAWNLARRLRPGMPYPQAEYGFFQNLNPIPGAIRAINSLLLSHKYDPYILTAPSTMNPLSYTEKRVNVEVLFGTEFVDRLIICGHKDLLRGDILVDDMDYGKGQDKFQGDFIHFGSYKFPDWERVLQHLGVSAQ